MTSNKFRIPLLFYKYFKKNSIEYSETAAIQFRLKPTSLILEHQSARLHYLRYEGGPKSMICFHGYGQDASYFKRFADRFSEDYTLYAVDLFHHGKSKWPTCHVPVTNQFYSEILTALLTQNNIKNFSFCGYSLGGKLVLCLAEKFFERLETIVLIAPDGIKTNFWYSMATYPYWMRRLFRYTVKNPGLYFLVSGLLYNLRLINKGVIRFARRQMNTESKRRKVYCTWLTYRKIKPDPEKIAGKVNIKGIRMRFYLGKYDKIITQKSIYPLISRLNHCETIILDKGHNTLIDDVARHKHLVL